MHDAWSISDGYFAVDGEWHPTPETTRQVLRAAMGDPVAGNPVWLAEAGRTHALREPCVMRLEDGHEVGPFTALPDDLPIGYHDLLPAGGGPTTRVIIHPGQCPQIPDEWGVATQIYALWSERSWGIGDLGDLAVLAGGVNRAGGRAILVSPLHQPAPSLPQQDSPYYPSSRRAWNPLLLAMDQPPPDPLLCAADTLVDRDRAWTLKREELAQQYRRERATANTEPDEGFVAAPELDTVACWNALCDEYGPNWREWPDPWRRFDRAALTARWAHDPGFADRVGFHGWCQQQFAEQLTEVARRGVDIIGDLAIGFSPDGADAWEYQDLLALDVRIGAPPDPFSLEGQEWGIPPFTPWRLHNAGFQPLIDTIRAALRNVQALRMDHVMGLFRQFWIPAGRPAAEGAYVIFPHDALLAIICIEASRARAYVVGEDLGTVEPGVREQLARHRIAGTRVLWFEDALPGDWPTECLATITTHDLPTVTGVFSGTDGTEDQLEHLRNVDPEAGSDEIVDAVHDALLASPARLRLLAMDDVCGAAERPNHPGTLDEYNWRRRLPCSVDSVTLRYVGTGRIDETAR